MIYRAYKISFFSLLRNQMLPKVKNRFIFRFVCQSSKYNLEYLNPYRKWKIVGNSCDVWACTKRANRQLWNILDARYYGILMRDREQDRTAINSTEMRCYFRWFFWGYTNNSIIQSTGRLLLYRIIHPFLTMDRVHRKMWWVGHITLK